MAAMLKNRYDVITGSTVVRPMQKSIGKWEIRHLQNCNLWKIMSARLPATQILVSTGAVRAFPQIGEILPPCAFFGLFCPVLSLPFLVFAPASNRWTDFYALWLKRRVSAQRWFFWGLERSMTIFGENMNTWKLTSPIFVLSSISLQVTKAIFCENRHSNTFDNSKGKGKGKRVFI